MYHVDLKGCGCGLVIGVIALICSAVADFFKSEVGVITLICLFAVVIVVVIIASIVENRKSKDDTN